jgi:putative Mg2+ transporter-C (MgtC) family protein
MQLTLTWEQIALRLALATLAGFFIGLNRDEHGHPAGIRTTILVCLAATLAMLQVNILLPMSGKTPSSFAVMDLMRNPLGILTGVGFIGAGVIMKRDDKLITGVTTAATMWFTTVLGLLFGGGQIGLGITGTLIAVAVLWALKYAENFIPREHHGKLALTFDGATSSEQELRQQIVAMGCGITIWTVTYDPPQSLSSVRCEVKWQERADRQPRVPPAIQELRKFPGVRTLTWDE